MSETNARTTVFIGGRELPLLLAALIAQEADRLGIPPCQVGDVVMPEPAPATVEVAGCTLRIEVAALLAEDADARGILVEQMVMLITHEHAEALDRRARRRESKASLEGAWMLPSDPSRRGGHGGDGDDA